MNDSFVVLVRQLGWAKQFKILSAEVISKTKLLTRGSQSQKLIPAKNMTFCNPKMFRKIP